MMKLGEFNALYINRFTPQGAYLVEHFQLEIDEDSTVEEVLLPTKYLANGAKEGDPVSVFLMKDSENRRVAVTDQPLLTLDTCAILRIVEINPYGAFADWGLDKNLMIPFAEQRQGVEIGDTYPIFLKYDELTDRLFGSMKIRKHLLEAPESICNERVTFMVTEHHELGWRGIVNQCYSGMLYRSDCRIPVKMGQHITCYAKLVRPDGKIDLQMSAGTVDKYDEAVSMIWEYLSEHKFLFLTDKSEAADIYNQFQLSKKTFKQAVGKLYKDRKIKLFEDKIARIDE
jgi:predicted RNA-binding protein (virulence factor B family)